MKLSFDLDSINYLSIEYTQLGARGALKLALKETQESDFIAVCEQMDIFGIEVPQNILISFITPDGIYKTKTTLKEVKNEEGYTYFVIKNPDTLDYQQSRKDYRVAAKYDCIYTIDDGYQSESYNAITYDISVGGVSIITEESAIAQVGLSIVIFLPTKDVKSHLKFVRCEAHEDNYKMAFEFTDLSEKDAELIASLCVKKQLS